MTELHSYDGLTQIGDTFVILVDSSNIELTILDVLYYLDKPDEVLAIWEGQETWFDTRYLLFN